MRGRPRKYGLREGEVYDEWAALCRLAGLPPTAVEWPESLVNEHKADCRRYASVLVREGILQLAPAFCRLRPDHRLGIYAHEIGHRILIEAGELDHSEEEADLAAAKNLKVQIEYDTTWPGKGLQRAAKASEEAWAVVDPAGVVPRLHPEMVA